MASVSHKVDENGVHAIGVTIDGKFVPFQTLTADEVEHLSSDAAPGAGFNKKDDDGKEG